MGERNKFGSRKITIVPYGVSINDGLEIEICGFGVLLVSNKLPQGRIGKTNGAVCMATATPQGNGKADNFMNKLGEKPTIQKVNHAIE